MPEVAKTPVSTNLPIGGQPVPTATQVDRYITDAEKLTRDIMNIVSRNMRREKNDKRADCAAAIDLVESFNEKYYVGGALPSNTDFDKILELPDLTMVLSKLGSVRIRRGRRYRGHVHVHASLMRILRIGGGLHADQLFQATEVQYKNFSKVFLNDFPLKASHWQAEFRTFQLRLAQVSGEGLARLVRLTNPTEPVDHFPHDLFEHV